MVVEKNATVEKDRGVMSGSIILRSYKAGTKQLVRETKAKNLIVSSSTGYGRNMLLRQMSNDSQYPIVIDSGKIGTGSTTPAESDTDLETIVLSGITVGSYELDNDQLIINFFMPDSELANNTYSEFGLFMNGRLFARALINPGHVKSSGEDTTVEYTIKFKNVT